MQIPLALRLTTDDERRLMLQAMPALELWLAASPSPDLPIPGILPFTDEHGTPRSSTPAAVERMAHHIQGAGLPMDQVLILRAAFQRARGYLDITPKHDCDQEAVSALVELLQRAELWLADLQMARFRLAASHDFVEPVAVPQAA